MSYTTIDNQLWNVQKYMMNRIGCDAAYRAMSPLNWYVGTGRASVPFLRWLTEAKPFVIARLLMKGGSDEEIINRLKAKAHIL